MAASWAGVAAGFVEWLVAPNERSTSSVTKTLLPFPFSGAINFDVLAFGVAFL
jgi:hypothetical protein